MTSELLLHEATRRSVDDFLAKPSHSLIIEGNPGAGKSTLADYLASNLLDVSIERLLQHPQIIRIEPENNTISIKEIREVYKFLKLKTTGKRLINRIVIVYDAELMTIEAQNALLKVLEEPPADTVMILLTKQKNKLLPTIMSRSQSLSIKRLNETALQKYFVDRDYSVDLVRAAYYASNGQIGLMSSILGNSQQSQLMIDLLQAKEVIAMPKLQRLAYVDTLSKQNDNILGFINALATVCQSGLKISAQKNDKTRAKRWHHSLKVVVDAENKLTANPNKKLLLTDLLINL